MEKDMVRLDALGPVPPGPFPVTTAELLAVALDEACLLGRHTTIDGTPARDCLQAYHEKKSRSAEETRLGSLLVRRGVLTKAGLRRALDRQKERDNLRLGEALVDLDLCKRDDIERHLREQDQVRRDIEDLDRFREKIESIKKRLSGVFQ